MAEEMEASRQKKRRGRKHRERPESMVRSSESPRPAPNPESKPETLIPVAPETLTSTALSAPAAMRRGKECRRKHQESALPASPLVEEAVRRELKKRKRRRHGEAAPANPSPSTAPAAQVLEVESTVAAKGATARKKQRRGAVEQEQSGQPPVSIDVHSRGREEAADAGANGVHASKMSRSKRRRVELKKQPLPQRFVPAIANPNSFVPAPFSGDVSAFFDQFRYKSDRQQDRNAPPIPTTPDRAAKPPPRGHPSSGSSLLSGNETSNVAKATTLNTKQRCSASASTSGSQKDVKVKGKEKPEKTAKEKKQRKPSPLLSAAEKRLDMYRRLPLDQLVPPVRSPHNLLQENYASDPWKVIVICMLLNLTQGKQVGKIVRSFFMHYPDAEAAYAADPEEMATHLKPLGLQRVKTKRIQKFSKAYVEEEWTHITELCGVGKYAADAYAIFCAGRAKEVVPEDHKLVDYWKYVCLELPRIQTSQNAQESAGVAGLGNVVTEVQCF